MDNQQILFPVDAIYIGRINKLFGSVEFAMAGQGKGGTYSDGVNTYSNVYSYINNYRFGLILHPTIYYGKHIAVNVSLGPAFAIDNVRSTNSTNSIITETFLDGQLRQASVYAGVMFRLCHSTQVMDDGLMLKLGYAVPIMKTEWYSGSTAFSPSHTIELSGFSVSLSGYVWSYKRSFVKKYGPNYADILLQRLRKDSVRASLDSTKSSSKKLSYSYLQYDFGYTGSAFKGEWKNMYDVTIVGVVYNKKYFSSLGFSGFSQNTPGFSGTPPSKVDSYLALHWNNEYLMMPDHRINFSFPLKIALVAASGWDTLPTTTSNQSIINWNFSHINYYQHIGTFMTISPGAKVFLNLFKSLSLGVGVNYCFALGVPKEMGTNADFSNYSIQAFLRLKFDTRAYNKRMLEKQRLILQRTK